MSETIWVTLIICMTVVAVCIIGNKNSNRK